MTRRRLLGEKALGQFEPRSSQGVIKSLAHSPEKLEKVDAISYNSQPTTTNTDLVSDRQDSLEGQVYLVC